jgi:hypothetical protein
LRDADVQRIVETAAHRLVRRLQQRGILDEAEVDTLAEKEPLLAAGRLQLIDADPLTFRLKTPWSDGTTHLLLSPLELIRS